MNNILIISVYDSGYGFSILIDNYVISREELEYPHHRYPRGLRQTAKTICEISWDKEAIKCYVELNLYSQFKHIIYCEDGSIEVWKDE